MCQIFVGYASFLKSSVTLDKNLVFVMVLRMLFGLLLMTPTANAILHKREKIVGIASTISNACKTLFAIFNVTLVLEC